MNSNTSTLSSEEEDDILQHTPKMTSVGLIYAGLSSVPSTSFSSLCVLFSNSTIYTRDFDNVIKLNNFFFPLLPSSPVICHSVRIPASSPYATIAAAPCPQKSLHKFPSVILELKVGMPIRLIQSISTNYEVDQGARLLIIEIGSQEILACLLLQDRFGKVLRIPRVITSCRDPMNPNFTYIRQQFPVEPGFASLLRYQIDDSVGVYAIFKSHQLA
ncbi:hypothetical protein MJO29_000103 [Puccinia striiformis f. sp. tritici]|nr:hypothetical protein MJO29_000103 [Puccinia striiformis f. sp. tritici]